MIYTMEYYSTARSDEWNIFIAAFLYLINMSMKRKTWHRIKHLVLKTSDFYMYLNHIEFYYVSKIHGYLITYTIMSTHWKKRERGQILEMKISIKLYMWGNFHGQMDYVISTGFCLIELRGTCPENKIYIKIKLVVWVKLLKNWFLFWSSSIIMNSRFLKINWATH